MAGTAAKIAKIKVSGTTVNLVNDITISEEIDSVDTTAFADTAPTSHDYTLCLKTGKLDFSGFCPATGPVVLASDTEVAFKMYLNATNYGLASGKVQGMQIGAKVDGVTTINYTCLLTSAITWTS